MKGSNWIPADAFESRVSRNTPGTTRLEPLFVALRTSHQNMIRNWGGGIYQRDTFYDLADENGILVWEGRNTILEILPLRHMLPLRQHIHTCARTCVQ